MNPIERNTKLASEASKAIATSIIDQDHVPRKQEDVRPEMRTDQQESQDEQLIMSQQEHPECQDE